ncbi:MAG: NlpC/P60 family protein [Anaeromusa sp.]|uniref:C40 family peptidase n=1 Tax=Anaeromusa sp. TaxID=1872520 RepID=UPI002B1E9729|nr:NlpC/P60 family protein [Anaeromusa sp.]MEA4835186.1 NlpC/P60 family protein [Anaeromusa sp.]
MQTYQRSVDLGAMPSARVESGAMPAAYGANVAQAMGGMGDALGKMAAVQDKIQEDKVASDVVAAQTEYRKRLSDALYAGDNALLSRKGENADKIDTEFTDTEKKIRQEVMGKLPGYELAQKAFLRTADQESTSGLELVNRYRQQEGQRTFKLNLVNAMDTAAETAARNYNNPVAIQQGLASTGTYLDTYAVRFGKAEADALRVEKEKSLVNKAMESAWGKEDFTSMKTLLDQYGDKLGADQASKWQHAMTERQKANEQATTLNALRNDPAFKDANGNFDVAKGVAYLRGLKKTTTTGGDNGANIIAEAKKQWGKPYGLGSDGSNATDCGLFTQQTINAVGGNLNTRTADGQYRQLEVDGKVFTDKNQLQPGDLVFWDVPSNRSRWTPTDNPDAGDNEAYKGITHVGIYEGNGKVIQAGSSGVGYMSLDQYPIVGYGKTAGAGGAAQTREEPMYDEATLAGLERQFQTFHAEDIRKDNEQQHFALRNVQDWLATNKDLPLDQKTAFVSASGLRPAQVEAINSGMIKQVQAEQKAALAQTSKVAEGALELLDARDALTPASVEAMAQQLSPDAYLRYMAKATRAQKTDGEKVNNAVDKDWHGLIKNDPIFGNADQQNALIGSITEILNVEHTEGYDRRTKAAKFIEEARDKGKREGIAGYSTRNNQAFQQMEELFPGASTLVRKGDPNVDGYEWMDILKRMSAQTYDDPAAAKAWNTIFENRLPLTENSFAELTEFYRQEGAQ